MAEPASKKKIIASAWILLTKAGAGQFSMRKLAKEVGISASTLYWHFPSKEAIFAEMVDEVCAEALMSFKVAGSWQQQMVDDGIMFAGILRQHSSSAELLFLTPPTTEHFLRVNEKFLQTIDVLTLADTEKFTIVNIFIDFILTFERDRQLRQEIITTHKTAKMTSDENLQAYTPILNRMYQQGIFNQMDQNATLEWSLMTLVKGFEQREKDSQD